MRSQILIELAAWTHFTLRATIVLAVAGCGKPDDNDLPPAPEDSDDEWFVDVAEQVGIRLGVDRASSGSYFMPDSMAAGCALFDYDQDGDLDVYLVNGFRHADGSLRSEAGANRLFRQESPSRFVDVTREAGVGDTGYGMGVAVGDLDNDGDLDLYVTNYGRDTLFRNDGGGVFSDITESAGITNDVWSASAGFFDFDDDGDLDLFITNYLEYDPARQGSDSAGRPEYASPKMFRGLPDVLYRNDGGGTFTDVSGESNISSLPGKGLGVAFLDLDGDGRRDIFVANDGDANFAWINQGDGTFIESAMEIGVAANTYGRHEAGMGVAVGDVDGDGDLDLFLTHLVSESNTLYLQVAPGRFEDATIEAGLAAPSIDFTGFGTAFADLDLDGDLDLVAVNGRVLRRPSHPAAALRSHWNPYAEPNQLFLNGGSGTFTTAAAIGGDLTRDVEVSRGLAAGDLDGDGDIDLLVSNGDGSVRVYRNEMPRQGRWLRVRAIDEQLNRDAFGAVIEVRAGEQRWVRLIDPATGYLSASDVSAHFGLGQNASFDGVTVRWAGGAQEEFPGGAADQALIVRRGEGAVFTGIGSPPGFDGSFRDDGP